jgi:hypothetical protein
MPSANHSNTQRIILGELTSREEQYRRIFEFIEQTRKVFITRHQHANTVRLAMGSYLFIEFAIASIANQGRELGTDAMHLSQLSESGFENIAGAAEVLD